MSEIDLFESEVATLSAAHDILAKDGVSGEEYRLALDNLAKSFHRLMRESRRVISRSDRTELELNSLNSRLQMLTSELDHKARHDNLTGVLNRGAVFERAEHYLTTSSLSLIVLDIDFFKRINDDLGHPAGDAVIRELVARLKTALNGVGEIGRVGGEEFTILLPEIRLDEAVLIAERVRIAIAGKTFSCVPERRVTASFGVSWSAANSNFEEAYGRADGALYKAKNGGRNWVEADTVIPAIVGGHLRSVVPG